MPDRAKKSASKESAKKTASRKNSAAKPERKSSAPLGFEATLWAAADKHRAHMDAVEYKHVVLGLISEELIALAKEINEAAKRGDALGLTNDEVAFYDALGVNESAVLELGDNTLKLIARELVEMVRRNTTIDWTVKETVHAKLRVMVKRILQKYGYPPDPRQEATRAVLEQAEVLCADWAA